MTEEQERHSRFNPFDLTKVWPQADYPLIPVGRIVLNRNPKNYFAEVEQAAFAPAHIIPGIDFSPDKMLQGRVFSYTDTHFHRLGPNYQQLPINCPYGQAARNVQRDGQMSVLGNQGDEPNYFPNSFGHTPEPSKEEAERQHRWRVSGEVARYETGDEDNFSQPAIFWKKASALPTRTADGYLYGTVGKQPT